MEQREGRSNFVQSTYKFFPRNDTRSEQRFPRTGSEAEHQLWIDRMITTACMLCWVKDRLAILDADLYLEGSCLIGVQIVNLTNNASPQHNDDAYLGH